MGNSATCADLRDDVSACRRPLYVRNAAAFRRLSRDGHRVTAQFHPVHLPLRPPEPGSGHSHQVRMRINMALTGRLAPVVRWGTGCPPLISPAARSRPARDLV